MFGVTRLLNPLALDPLFNLIGSYEELKSSNKGGYCKYKNSAPIPYTDYDVHGGCDKDCCLTKCDSDVLCTGVETQRFVETNNDVCELHTGNLQTVGESDNGAKCFKRNKDAILSRVSYLYYDTFCDSDIIEDGEKIRPHLHNRWLFDQGQKPSNERDYDLDSQFQHGFAGPNGKGDSKCSVHGYPLAEVCEPSWCPDDTSAPIAKGPLLGTQVWTLVGEAQFLKHVQDAHGCPGTEDDNGVFIPTSSNQTITLSCYNPYAEGSENSNSDPCGNHPTQVTMQTTATTVTTVTTVKTLVKCGPGEYLVGDNTSCKTQPTCSRGSYITSDSITSRRSCYSCGANTYQDDENHRSETCKPQPYCSAGQRMSANTDKEKRTCSECPAGEIQPNTQHRLTTCGDQDTVYCKKGERTNCFVVCFFVSLFVSFLSFLGRFSPTTNHERKTIFCNWILKTYMHIYIILFYAHKPTARAKNC